MQNNKSGLVLGLMSVLAFGACKKTVEAPTPSAPEAKVKVGDVKLGNAVGADKKVVDSKSNFRPTDTIYVSVETEGSAPEATMTARWTFGDDDQLVNESSQRIIPNGAVATEFHVQKPDGFPEGKYEVEILVNGEKVAEKDFEVEVGS